MTMTAGHPRLARQNHAVWDKQAQRYVCKWRIPTHLIPIARTVREELCERIQPNGTRYKDQFPRHISPAEKVRLEAERLVEYNHVCEALGYILADPEHRAEAIQRLRDQAAPLLIEAGLALVRAKASTQRYHDQLAAVKNLIALGLPVPVPATAPTTELAGTPITPADVVKVWANEYRNEDRLKREPSDQAKAAKIGVLEYMFDSFIPPKPHDLRLITADDLKVHRAYLLGDPRPGRKGRKPNSYDHIQQIKTCFAVAARTFVEIASDPADKLQGLPKNKQTGVPFEPHERIAALVESATCEPEIMWAHWLSAFTSAIPSELRYLTPASFRTVDGKTWHDPAHLTAANYREDDAPGSVKVVMIVPPAGYGLKTLYRPRILPLHTSLLANGLWEWVAQIRAERGDNAPLFDRLTEAQFSNGINGVLHRLAERPGLEGLQNPLKRFYSHRHYVITDLDGRMILDDEGRRVDAGYIVGGHAPPNVHKGNYVKVSMARLATAIETLQGA